MNLNAATIHRLINVRKHVAATVMKSFFVMKTIVVKTKTIDDRVKRPAGLVSYQNNPSAFNKEPELHSILAILSKLTRIHVGV